MSIPCSTRRRQALKLPLKAAECSGVSSYFHSDDDKNID
jgi:hypothetical protein